MAFTRMDRGTYEDWQGVREAAKQWKASMPQRIKALLLQLAAQDEGFAIDQLQHGLQTATRALRADASEEMVVAALCHDIGDVISKENHPAISAEILRPYVSRDVYEIVRAHQDFQLRHYHESLGGDRTARLKHVLKPWYRTACRFSDEWDQRSFDPDYDTLPLDHFAPMLDRVFRRPRRSAKLGTPWARVGRWLRRRAKPLYKTS